MGKNKKNKQNKSPPKKEQKSESIKQKRKEAVSHPQNPPPQTVSEEEQHSMKEQVIQPKNVDDIEPTTQSTEDVDDIEPTTQSTEDVDDIEPTTQSTKNLDDIEPTTQSAIPESSQDVQNYPSSSSSLPQEQKRLAEDDIFFESNKMKGGARGTVNSNKVDREDKPDPYSKQRHAKRKDYKKLDYSKQNNERTAGDCKESNKMSRGAYTTDNSNDVDGNDKRGSYSRQCEYPKYSKKDDYPKQNTERIGRDGYFKGNNRTRDNWRENDYRSDDKGFDEFLKISKRKIPNDSYREVNEIDGDLFDMSVEYSLAHCVAEDMNMGSGIAVRFSQQFKRLGELYNQRAKQGGLAVLDDNERYIYYLVTKKVSNGKPTLQTMWNSLQKLKQHIEDNNVKKLAMPRIGCGLDRLEWSVVKNMLEYTFRETVVQITVCNYQQCEDDGQTSGVPNKQNKCYLKNVSYPIVAIDPNTAIIYFGAEDRSMFDDIEDLDTKFKITMDYKNSRKQLGEIIQKYNPNKSYCLYGCIVRKTKDDPFDFINFQKCITQLKKMNKNDYYYVAFQAFVDSDDDLIVTKIGNMLRCSLINVEVYVCWGDKMQHLMPQDRSNNFY